MVNVTKCFSHHFVFFSHHPVLDVTFFFKRYLFLDIFSLYGRAYNDKSFVVLSRIVCSVMGSVCIMWHCVCVSLSSSRSLCQDFGGHRHRHVLRLLLMAPYTCTYMYRLLIHVHICIHISYPKEP